MSKPLKQSGSAHLIIIVILVLAVIGVLGFVFWRNISQQAEQTSNIPKSSNTVANSSESDYITLNDWGVKFKIADQLKSTVIEKTVQQSKDMPPITSYNFTTKRIHDLGGACATQPFENTEVLTRVSNKPNATPDGTMLNSTAIDGYYYILGAPSAICTAVDSNGALLKESQINANAQGIEASDRTALKSTIETIQSVKTNDKFLVLADWNIQFQIPAYLNDVTYHSHHTNTDTGMDAISYEFSTKAVEALGGDCVSPGVDGYVTALAGMSRSKQKISSDYTPYLNEQPINGYYYYLTGAQSLCANTGEDIQVRDRASVMDMLMNPVAK